MRQVSAALFVVCFGAVAQVPVNLAFPREGVIPVLQSQAAGVFRQCSRSAPEAETGLGLPSPAEIEALEAGLPKLFSARASAGLSVPPGAVQYHRQYVAFTRGGTRLIYGNFFPSTLVRSPERRSLPVAVCDGGPSFWGIVFNPSTRNFEAPQFNGEA